MKTARKVWEISAFKVSLSTLTFYKKTLLPFSKKPPSQTQLSSLLSQDIYSTNPKQIQKCPVLVRLWQDQWVQLFQPKCTEDFKPDFFFFFFQNRVFRETTESIAALVSLVWATEESTVNWLHFPSQRGKREWHKKEPAISI